MAEEDSNQKVPRDGGTVITPCVPQSDQHMIGEFEIVAKLGEGGMGAVYKGRQTSLDRFVAIKILPAHFTADPEFIARFKREAKAAAALSHQNIVQAYAAGESNGQHYFAMEFVDGETLLHRIKHKKRIDPIEAVAVCENVAQGLEYAWRKAKIIHRDIKPDNIFISNDGEVKLGDLGLAKQTGDQSPTLTAADVSMGTPHYVSPEQVMADKKIDFRADIYSLGCTLFHAVTGRFPYDGDSAMAIMMKHVNEPPPDIRKVWSACPAPLVQLLDKMLQKDRDKRHQSYEELIADLNRVDRELQQLAVVAKKKEADALKPGPSFGVILGAIGAVSAVVIGLFVWAPWKSKAPSVTQQTAAASQRVAAAPTPAATSSQTQPAIPPQPLEPGAIRLWDSADKIPNQTGVRWENSTLILGDDSHMGFLRWTNRPSLDGIIRADIQVTPGAYMQIGLRHDDSQRDFRISPLGKKPEIQLCFSETGSIQFIKSWKSPREFGPGDWVRVELRAIGDEFTVLADGRVLGSIRDNRHTIVGSPFVLNSQHLGGPIRNIVYVPLDRTAGVSVGGSTAGVAANAPFVKEVAALSPEQQVKRVVAELKKLNPGFDGKADHRISQNGSYVAELTFTSSGISNLSPLRALTTLLILQFQGKDNRALSDLRPLRGLQLEKIGVVHGRVSDLSPLGDMPLHQLVIVDNPVTNLAPLGQMTGLTMLMCNGIPIQSLAPLNGSSLQDFKCDPELISVPGNREILSSIPTLLTINALPVAEFWKQVDAGKTPNASASDATSDDADWQNAINLLPLIDPAKDAVAGAWRRQDDDLVTDGSPYARLEIPYQPPAEYDVRTEFTTRSGTTRNEIIQILSAEGHPFLWKMGAYDKSSVYCFQVIDEKVPIQVTGGANQIIRPLGVTGSSGTMTLPAAVTNVPLKAGQRYTSLVRVRRDGFAAFVGGKLILQCKADSRHVRMEDKWALPDPSCLGIAGQQTPATFHRIEVREVTGKGTFTRGNPSATGWRDLFDGKTLDGWITKTYDGNNAGKFSLRDGSLVIEGPGRMKAFEWAKEFSRENYEISFEVNCTTPAQGTRSGSLLVNIPASDWRAQFNLDGKSVQNILTAAGPGGTAPIKKDAAFTFATNRWYTINVTLAEKRLRLSVDGTLLLETPVGPLGPGWSGPAVTSFYLMTGAQKLEVRSVKFRTPGALGPKQQ